MPLDDVRRAEARVALAFWQRALNHEDEAALFATSFSSWRDFFTARFTEAVSDGRSPRTPTPLRQWMTCRIC